MLVGVGDNEALPKEAEGAGVVPGSAVGDMSGLNENGMCYIGLGN
jgi:hypothetical protein